jgi:hypothetical protein
VRSHRAFVPILALALFAIVAQTVPASTQGGLFGWFGGQRDDRYPSQNSWSGGGERRDNWFGRHERQLPPQTSAYSDPYNSPGRAQNHSSHPSGGSTGRTVAYCVRLCDGRYFPMHRHGNATSVQLCNAFCPAAKTQVFNGSAIDHAAASSGARYADLDNAFVYREKIVPNCTCNGKDSFGLSRIDVAADPTLRPGDIVASGDNVKAALIAMNAAKERAAAAREATSERQALRAGTSRRAAVAPQSSEPAAEPDERPED